MQLAVKISMFLTKVFSSLNIVILYTYISNNDPYFLIHTKKKSVKLSLSIVVSPIFLLLRWLKLFFFYSLLLLISRNKIILSEEKIYLQVFVYVFFSY